MQNNEKVQLQFSDGSFVLKDLVVFADGGNSFSQKRLCPDQKLEYSGHVAWRGMVPVTENLIEKSNLEEKCVIYHRKHSHMIVYKILKGSEKFFNWVWYQRVSANDLPHILVDRTGVNREFSIPEGMLTDEKTNELKAQANSLLPPMMSELIQKTHNPFCNQSMIESLIV